jgi:hypothetical protein
VGRRKRKQGDEKRVVVNARVSAARLNRLGFSTGPYSAVQRVYSAGATV